MKKGPGNLHGRRWSHGAQYRGTSSSWALDRSSKQELSKAKAQVSPGAGALLTGVGTEGQGYACQIWTQVLVTRQG